MASFEIRWWNRLSVKLTAAIAAISLATLSTFVYLELRSHRDHLVAEVVRGAALFSDTIRSSTYHHMLADMRADAYRTMETIGQQEGIERVRFFNKEGRVTFSTERAEIDTFVDTRAESCFACHEADQPIERLAIPSRSRIYHARDGHRTLGMVTPIYNEPACYTAPCHVNGETVIVHPESQRVLGVVDIGISLARIDGDLASLQRRTSVLGGIAVLVLAAVVGLFTRRFVVHPVVALVQGTERLSQGDLSHRIDVRRQDELGRLATSFNGMADSLGRSRAERLHLLETLEKQVEERTAALRDAQAQLIQSEKLASLGKLAASIAHEINNPLTGILTYAKLLVRMLNEDELDEKTLTACVRHLRLVQRETERCTVIVRNLLDFARQRPLSLKQMDLRAAVEEALSLLGNQAGLRGISVEKDLQELPSVFADFGQLRQAILNIVLNACEAIESGGTVRVSSRFLPEEKMVKLDVSDNGVGIAPEHLTKILDPFFTTKEKGTGLGLSVVYGIIERHGGRLDIRSEVGKGTTVSVRLPVEEAVH
jgi:two-component system, NtrC family, sensor kinase